ncbi:MAG: HD-GYP domain-containing protein [Oscillospiraceae bacterium]|nr:HD-GYP domain-containing protein [Oscillospiraceae bacterium]
MLYIPLERIKEGMLLARPVYGADFNILIARGLELQEAQIKRIAEMGYPGVYIDSSDSSDISIKDVVPDSLRINTAVAAKELLNEVESGLRQKTNLKVNGDTQRRIVMPVIGALIDCRRRVIELVDLKPLPDYSYYHAANVVIISILLGLEMGITGSQLYELGMASLIHDAGNTFIPKSIMQKPGRLSAEEYEVVKKHTEMGFQLLRERFDISIDACIGALQHHEHYDGSGYPNRLKKDKISIYGRIIAVADVYDALVSRRPFRPAMLPPEAMEFMRFNEGTMFDPEIVVALRRIISLYPTGMEVELNTGVRCVVAHNYAGSPERPRLRLLNGISKVPSYIDLQIDRRFENIRVSHIVI